MCLMPNENLENKSFESLKHNISDATEDILLDNSCDPDSNYFNTETKNFDTPYVIPEEFHRQFKNQLPDGLSFLHIIIRSIIRTLKISSYSFLPWVLHLVYFVTLRHGLMKQHL